MFSWYKGDPAPATLFTGLTHKHPLATVEVNVMKLKVKSTAV